MVEIGICLAGIRRTCDSSRCQLDYCIYCSKWSGPGFSTRYYVGIALSFIALLFLSIFRFLNHCETMGVITLSIAFGFLLGLVLAFQNHSLFGKEALNVLGIPYFSGRTADGKPIYVCPQATITPTS